jgi:hypothetical protein
MASALKWGGRIVAALGMVGILMNIVAPAEFSLWISLGLALLVSAFLFALLRNYITRTPSVPGGSLEPNEHYIAHEACFLMAVTLFSLVAWIIFRAH